MASGPETRMHPMVSLGRWLWHKWYLGSFYPAYFYSAKIMVSLQKEMVIQLMGFYRNFVQIDNG